MTRPMVAIVGRPNVGKSTLFNRLIGEKKAIMDDLPGTTRDRIYAITSLEEHEVTLVDTGGLELKPESTIRQMVRDQVKVAIAEAEVVLFVVDAHDGVVPADEEIVDILYRSEKPVILVVNKVDNRKYESEVVQFYELGIGEPVPISAYHSKGLDELLERVAACLPSAPPAAVESELMKVAIVGRPNVGKSMLLNSLIGEERTVVDEVPGTTRDAIDTVFSYNGESVVFIDTAGIRRRGRIEQGIEQYSMIRALRAIDRADVALLVTDASEGITAQDTHVLSYIQQAYKGMVLIVNKWDLVAIDDEAQWTAGIRQKIKFMPHLPILFTSAKTGYGVTNILTMARRIYEERSKHISTSQLNSLVKEAVAAHPLPTKAGQRLKIFYAAQTGVAPPTFVFFVNNAKLVHFSYRRYLENKLRRAFGFQGIPIRFLFRSRGEKVAEKI